MKKIKILLLIFLFVKCTVKKQPEYIIPSTLTETELKAYVIRFNEAKGYYDSKCAKCHTTRKWFKKYVPVFSEKQMSQYAMKEINEEHGGAFTPDKISSNELHEIFFYLRHINRTPKK